MNKAYTLEEAEKFFKEAINKWSELIQLILPFSNAKYIPTETMEKGNGILDWFQNNYSVYRKFSDFSIIMAS